MNAEPGPTIYSNDNRAGRRALAKKVRGPNGKRVGKVQKGDAAKMDPRYGDTAERACGHCYEAGRGIVPMKLHRDMQRPCPDVVLMVDGAPVALYGVKLTPFQRAKAPGVGILDASS